MRLDKYGLPEHGGVFSGDVLDFSANLNPLGMPNNVREALIRSVGEWERYPDPDCTELTKRLSERLGVPPENIVCGNGADDLLYRIVGAIRPKHAMVSPPCFSEYEKVLDEVGAWAEGIVNCEATGYTFGKGILKPDKFIGKGDMIVFASPNNPTGRVIQRELLRGICEKCERDGSFFLCDECFLGFTENAASVLEFMNPNVIMLSAFTKIYAMAGLRLGYAVFGDAELADTVRRRGQYWSVSAPAQTAGIAALEAGEEYLEKTRHLISEQRQFLTNELSGLGIKVFPSDANFLLLKTEIPLYDALFDRGIVIRRCGNFGGLDDKFYRIAVRTEKENARFLAAVKEIING